MPLEDHIPTIDDRRFDDIMTEVRARIARYTPEWTPVWTDVNDSDPGVTLTQVFAWLAEMQLYRMGRVPELNYIKFLQLLGIELRAAEPAQAEISFPVKENHAQPVVIVPARTQVSAESSEGSSAIIFETERALKALTAGLVSLQAFDGYTFTPVTEANKAATAGFLPFGSSPRPDCGLYLGFAYGSKSTLTQMPRTELDLAVFVAQGAGKTSAYPCGLPQTPAYGPARLRWEYWSGSEWLTLELLKDETLALTRSGHVLVKLPAAGAIVPMDLVAEGKNRFWIRCRVEKSQYERAPRLLAVRTNTVAAIQAETIGDEVLGGSSGRRDQVFTLSDNPVLQGSLRLEIDEGEGYQVWTEVEDLLGSGPYDRHYVLDRTSGQVRLGDGTNGAIPVRTVTNPDANVIARQYRVGGGRQGNVAAGTIKTPVTSLTGIDDSGVGNLLAAHSGRDEERLEEAKKRARRSIRSRCRAVTAEDFEQLAMEAANVKRAKALPLFHPEFPGVPVPGVITVIVVPDGDAPNPVPSEGTLRTVCAYLDQRRLLTSELYVIRPTYQQVAVEAEVVVEDSADLAEVKQGIEKALLAYFHPLTGGEDGQGWPLGGTIFYSRVYQRVFGVTGVQSIDHLVISLDGEAAPECTNVPLRDASTLLYCSGHRIDAQYGFGS